MRHKKNPLARSIVNTAKYLYRESIFRTPPVNQWIEGADSKNANSSEQARDLFGKQIL
jgi:hypothetical protein